MAELDAIRLENQQLHQELTKLPKLDEHALLETRDRTLKKFPSIRNRTETKARFRDLLNAFVNELTNNQ